jgi:hypothetical protein
MWTQAREVRRLILSDDFEFRQSCANYCTIMKEVVATLKEFDGKQPCMGNIYIIMKALHHYVAALHNAPFNTPSYLVDLLDVAFRKKQVLTFSNLHYASALLNPHLIHNMELCDDQHTMA